MTERSVSKMRAMFEGKQDTSPPSRGRSPAASERSTGSQNISSIRNSFVAVERSGQMGPMLGLRRISDAASTTSAGDRLRPADGVSPGQLNGGDPMSRTSSLSKVQEEEKAEGAPGDLGAILKGSPFEDKSKSGSQRSGEASTHVANGAEAKLQEVKPKRETSTPAKRVAENVAGPKSAAPSLKKEPKSTSVTKPAPISTKQQMRSKDKSGPTSAETPTSATRSGPAVKVSSPRTATAREPDRTPLKKAEPKLSTKPSRASLSTATSTLKATRPKSPARPAPTTKQPARQSNASLVSKQSRTSLAGPDSASAVKQPARQSDASLRSRPSRASLAGPDPELLNRMMRPTQSSANKFEKDERDNGKKAPRTSTVKAPDSGFLERMLRPTQASSKKHEEQQPKAPQEPAKKPPADSKFLERMMRPTQASSSKHDKELDKRDDKKMRTSTGSVKASDSGFLERMMRPTAASSGKTHHGKETENEANGAQPASTTKAATAAAVTKPKHKIEQATSKSAHKSNLSADQKKADKDTTDHPTEHIANPTAPADVALETKTAGAESKVHEPVKAPAVAEAKPQETTRASLPVAANDEHTELAASLSDNNLQREQTSAADATEAVPVPSSEPEPVEPPQASVSKSNTNNAVLPSPPTIDLSDPSALDKPSGPSGAETSAPSTSQETHIEPAVTEAAAREAGDSDNKTDTDVAEAPVPSLQEGKKIVAEAAEEVNAQEKQNGKDGLGTTANASLVDEVATV